MQRFEPLPLVDANEFDKLLDDVGSEVMAITLETFVAESEARLGRIRTGLAGEALTREAHSLKGGAATFGAVRLVEIARTIESQSTDGKPSEPGLVEAAEWAFAAARVVLEGRLESCFDEAA
jgi:HPt (histidine-containing phosphotransfer) domain-containing protein